VGVKKDWGAWGSRPCPIHRKFPEKEGKNNGRYSGINLFYPDLHFDKRTERNSKICEWCYAIQEVCEEYCKTENLCKKDKDDLLKMAKELCAKSNTEENLQHIDRIIVAVCAKIKARFKHDIVIHTVWIQLANRQSKSLIKISAQEKQLWDMFKEQIEEIAFRCVSLSVLVSVSVSMNPW